MKTILCYGDSNTWGYIPNERNENLNRYPLNIRWPGLLQNYLENDFNVIEEGLNGRTTNLDYHIPPDRNGKKYLAPCLYSHAPIDLVILGLGGNDLKKYFDRSAQEICNGLKELISIIKASTYGNCLRQPPKILILSVPIPQTIAEEYTDENGVKVFKGSIDKARLLNQLSSNLSQETGCYFLDTSNIPLSNLDGLHFDEYGHKLLAEIIYKKIKQIFVDQNINFLNERRSNP